jgi:hypothetical protein
MVIRLITIIQGWIKFKFAVAGGLGGNKCTFCHFAEGKCTVLQILGKESAPFLPFWGRKVHHFSFYQFGEGKCTILPILGKKSAPSPYLGKVSAPLGNLGKESAPGRWGKQVHRFEEYPPLPSLL